MDDRPRAGAEGLSRIRSELDDDPEMARLVGAFVDDLDGRVEEISSALANADRERLTRLAHRLRGAASGYGFGVITTCAADLEAALLGAEADLSSIAEKVEDLVALCRRATAGE